MYVHLVIQVADVNVIKHNWSRVHSTKQRSDRNYSTNHTDGKDAIPASGNRVAKQVHLFEDSSSALTIAIIPNIENTSTLNIGISRRIWNKVKCKYTQFQKKNKKPIYW